MTIRRMTRSQYSYDRHEFGYRLPFSHVGRTDEELVEEWAEWVKRYPGGRAQCMNIQRDEEGHVRLSFLYEGDGEYHPFALETRLVYLTDLDLVAIDGWVEQAVHDLMTVVLRMDFFPHWEHVLGLQPV